MAAYDKDGTRNDRGGKYDIAGRMLFADGKTVMPDLPAMIQKQEDLSANASTPEKAGQYAINSAFYRNDLKNANEEVSRDEKKYPGYTVAGFGSRRYRKP